LHLYIGSSRPRAHHCPARSKFGGLPPVIHSTPLHSTPLHSTPLHSTPLHSTHSRASTCSRTCSVRTRRRSSWLSGCTGAWCRRSCRATSSATAAQKRSTTRSRWVCNSLQQSATVCNSLQQSETDCNSGAEAVDNAAKVGLGVVYGATLSITSGPPGQLLHEIYVSRNIRFRRVFTRSTRQPTPLLTLGAQTSSFGYDDDLCSPLPDQPNIVTAQGVWPAGKSDGGVAEASVFLRFPCVLALVFSSTRSVRPSSVLRSDRTAL
jgi:hypothetical protein